MSVHVTNAGAVHVGVTVAALTAVVPDGVASLAGKVAVAIVAGFVSGFSVKAGGALWNWLSRKLSKT